MILITGATGYLGHELLKHLDHDDIMIFVDRLNISVNDLMIKYGGSNITHIYHLAAPTTEDDFARLGKNQLYKSIVRGTQTMIEFANQVNAQLVYFSTEGILENLETANDYCRFKSIATDMVKYVSNYHKILVVPRVYSAERENGIISKLRDDRVPYEDMNRTVEYIELASFIKQFKEFIVSNDTICYFKDKQISTLQELKTKYIA